MKIPKCEGWIQTYTGIKFYPLNPKPEDINILDIAHSLALQTRFNGHCLVPYSVAQHSYLICNYLNSKNYTTKNEIKWGLLHDASEAYLCDLPRPIKQNISAYNEMEYNLHCAIAKRFSLSPSIPEIVKCIDNRILKSEKDILMGRQPDKWGIDNLEPLDIEIEPVVWSKAESVFLKTYNEIFNINNLG